MDITAAVVEELGGPFEVQELELGALRDDEILVRIAAAGICHTDLLCRDQALPVPLPAVLGHEGAGIVIQTGKAVEGIAEGDRVVLSYDVCGVCPACTKGRSAYCHAFYSHNFAAVRPEDGSSVYGDVRGHFFGQSSFATHSVARARNLVKVDDDIPLEIAAPFGCGIQTGAGAVLNALEPEEGSSIAIFGAGAVGLAAVLAAHLAGCETIIVVDPRWNRLELAEELGATHVVDASTVDPGIAIRAVTGSGSDYTLEASGAPEAIRHAFDALAPLGVCGIAGVPAVRADVSFDVSQLRAGGRVVRGISAGHADAQDFLPRLFGLWRSGKFPVDRMMRFYDFEEIDRAAREAESGEVIKPVLRMEGRD